MTSSVGNNSNEISTAVGIISDHVMLKHCCTWDENHVEIPGRLYRSLKKCQEMGLTDRCLRLEPCEASENDILLYHDRKLLDTFKDCHKLNEGEMEQICQRFDDVYLCEHSYRAAMVSAGCTIEAARALVEKRCRHAMALVRPPGHHAMVGEANGFCLFNNVVIAAKKMFNEYGLRKIAIIDWDVHHGQGTQRAFYDNEQVLYVSIHRYEFGSFWPCLRESNWDYIGEGSGTGFNVNIPLNETGLGDAEYICIFLRIILPILTEYGPDLILISSGYDAAIGCPEGQMLVTPACYGHMTRMLTAIGRPVCVVLEGGYCLDSLEESVASTLSSLLGDPYPRLEHSIMNDNDGGPAVKSSVSDVIMNLTYLLRNYWTCMENAAQFYDFMLMDRNLQPYRLNLSNLKYTGNPMKLEKYPTRNHYKPRPAEEAAYFRDKIRKLISSYDLASLRKRTDLIISPVILEDSDDNDDKEKQRKQINTIFNVLNAYDLLNFKIRVKNDRTSLNMNIDLNHISKLEMIDKAEDVGIEKWTSQIWNDVIHGRYRNGLILINSSKHDWNIPNILSHKEQCVLILDISSLPIFINATDTSGNLVYIKITDSQKSKISEVENSRLISVDRSMNMIFLLYNVILPFVYCKSPNILIKIDANDEFLKQKSSEIAVFLYLRDYAVEGRIFTTIVNSDNSECDAHTILRAVLPALCGFLPESRRNYEIPKISHETLKAFSVLVTRYLPEAVFPFS